MKFGQPPGLPTKKFGNPATFTAAANTQASDYDSIMSQYANFARQSAASPLTTSPITSTNIAPQLAPYQQSGDVTRSLTGLSDLSTTGGYSEADIANLRARGIAPTRSIYANAQQNVERQRALQGGYSPNFGATQAQMARDESNQIADINTNINAGIAQNVAANRLSAAPSYASASATANAAQTQSDQANAAIVNEINQINEQNRMRADEFNTQTGLSARLANRQLGLGAIQGQASLYGTTPALTNLFGNQVIQAGQLGQSQQALNNQTLNTYGGFMMPGGGYSWGR